MSSQRESSTLLNKDSQAVNKIFTQKKQDKLSIGAKQLTYKE